MSKKNVEGHLKHLMKVPVKSETDDELLTVCIISLNFGVYFLVVLEKIIFVVISGNYLYL